MNIIRSFAVFFLMVMAPQIALADSAYGCFGLADNKTVAALEGKHGVFFRIYSDLRLHHAFSEHTVMALARLDQALKRRGTTLIYAMVPTKAQAMPNALPEQASLYGYSPEISEQIYHDILHRLHRQTVAAPDLQMALQKADPNTPPFFKADFHWTAQGARLAAQAIAKTIRRDPAYAALDKSSFTTRKTGIKTGFSGMRRALQSQCKRALPRVETMTFQTTGDASASLDIFAKATAPDIVLLGTSFSDSALSNFAGFLGQYTGLQVENHAMTGGNQFGAITSYLTSRAYRDTPPRYLIWENPIYNNLAQFGPFQMEELITAAGATCRRQLPTRIQADGSLTTQCPLSGFSPQDVILADFGSTGAREAHFKFTTTQGLVQTTKIIRGGRLSATGRFYQNLAAFQPADIRQISVRFSSPTTADASLTLCSPQPEDAS